MIVQSPKNLEDTQMHVDRDLGLLWHPTLMPSLTSDGGNDRSFGTLYCADGDGLWTVLIVRPGEEHIDIERKSLSGEISSDYGFGWRHVGNSSHPGAYFFNQSGLVGSIFVAGNQATDLDVDKFIQMSLRLAEMRMTCEDPVLYDFLLSKNDAAGRNDHQVIREKS